MQAQLSGYCIHSNQIVIISHANAHRKILMFLVSVFITMYSPQIRLNCNSNFTLYIIGVLKGTTKLGCIRKLCTAIAKRPLLTKEAAWQVREETKLEDEW